MTRLPAAPAAPIPSGRTTRPETQRLVNDVHRLLNNCGVRMSPSKVSRLVRDYQAQVARNGYSLTEFLANRVQMNGHQKAKLLTYADPTGETAVINVMRAAR